MEPITHFLTGACMSRAGCNRKSAMATLTMVLAAEAADIDVLWSLKSSTAGLQHHRGITHSFVGVPFMAAGVLLIVYLLHRWRSLRSHVPKPANPDATLPVRWGYLYFFAVLAALSHLWLDYATAYGIRLFEPFNYRWYSWDLVFIIEPLMLLALLAGLTLPALFGLINQEIGVRSKGPRGRVGAIIALLCLVLIWSVRGVQHGRAVSALDSFLYHGEAPQRVAAYPYMINPFRWHGVVETADFLETVPANSVGPDVQQSQARLYYKPPETDVTRAAKASYFGRLYLDWAVFPYVQTYKPEEAPGFLVEFQDLRFTYPDMRGSRGALTGFVLLSPNLRVIDEGMNSRRSPAVQQLMTSPAQR